ncbi:MAG: hypothetical protein E7434_07525 [Ruminococcaceae bacterium]|nr:hypothetical protein [Oscillospiraceae bacterium]
MSDNVIPIFEEETPQKRISLKKQWIIFISIVAMIIVLLVWFLFTQTTALDGVKRFFRYFGVDENAYGDVHFEAYGNTSYAMVGSSFAVASQSGLQLFSESGETLCSLSGSFTNPLLKSVGDRVLLYDVGGTRLVLLNADGDVLFDLIAGGKIFDADLCEDSLCSVLYEGNDCYTVLDVFNENGARLFTHRSESAFLNACAISPDGSYVVVTTLGQEDISFLSTARILSTSSEEIQANVSFGTQLICDLAFLDDDTACAIGEDTLFFVDMDGSVKEEYIGESAKIAGYCFTESQLVILYDRYDLSLGYDLVCLNEEGEQTASLNIGTQPTYFSQCENYICLLTPQEIRIYDHDLSLSSTKAHQAYLAALAREDGTALCIGSGFAELYIP